MKNTLILVLFLSLGLLTNAQTLKDEWILCNTQGCKILDPYFSDGITVKWEGSCFNNKANGSGKLTKYKNGEYESTYEGEYKNGIREGKGKFTHKDGTIYEGQFVNGQLMGKGTMHSDDGQRYVGEFINYRAHGNGTTFFANGSKFEGFLVSDRMYTGKFTNFDGKVTYRQEYYFVEKINEKRTGYKPEIGVKVTEYFDDKWNRCKQKDASYYRLVTYESENRPKGIVKDYFITGQVQNEFYAIYIDYDDNGKNFEEGEATWYFKNGEIQQKRYYLNNNINGMNTFYYENGQKEQESNYNLGTLDGEYKQWYQTGKLKLLASYDNGKLVDNKYIEYDENGSGALVYNENFRLNEKIWEHKFDDYESSVTEENKLKLILEKDKSVGIRNYITLDQNSDYSIESVICKKTGKDKLGYGLLFGFKDWDNYYEFLISEIGSFTIYQKFEGVYVKITDWTKSSVINTGNQPNQLKLFKFKDEFIFSINGQVVERKESSDLRGNYFGMTANARGEYSLESIRVKEFLSIADLEKKSPKSKSTSESNWKGNGSGFFINERGYIATNYHVIKDAKDIQVEYFQKGVKQIFQAKVIVSDKQNDLAIIKIDDADFKALPRIPYVFNTAIKDVGSEIFALGYPIANVMGEEVKFTDGKISSKTGIEGDITVYQISAPIQSGNSGGPLFDSKGNLVGITSSALNRERFNSENVNYAIKCTYLKNLIDVLPESISIPNDLEIYNKPLTEKIKILSEFVPIIKIR